MFARVVGATAGGAAVLTAASVLGHDIRASKLYSDVADAGTVLVLQKLPPETAVRYTSMF